MSRWPFLLKHLSYSPVNSFDGFHTWREGADPTISNSLAYFTARGTITYYELLAESLMIVPGARWTIFPPSRVRWHFKFLISLEGIV